MTFLLFILFLVLLLILVPILRLVGAFFRFRNRMRQTMSGFAGNSNQGFSQKSAKKQQTSRRRRKVYPRDEGEYVSFEEIITDRTTTTSDTGRSTKIYSESQISDAEFEEIKE